jgi:glycosyltransferase involved in cell wall biosynthesis
MELTTRDAAAIIAISASTKRDLVRLYGVNEARISVVHLGATDFTPLRKSLRWVPPDRYVLFVGGRRGYKNFDVLVEALPPVFVRDRSLHLVCAGGGSFTREELNAFASSGLAGRIHQVNVDDETLGVVYARAVALIYPSRYEGFGMPVLEAFNCGCPVIAARVSSIPEIGGDAALYIDPQDPSSICASLDRLLDDPDQRVDLASRGRARVQEFTWERTARATAKVYRSVLNL